MGASVGAELFKIVKRPAVWVLLAAWLVANQVFSFVIPYLSYRGSSTPPEAAAGRTPDEILADALPANLVENAIAGLPLFGGALLLVLGGLVMGSEYGWDTLRTMFTQRPRRLAIFGGKLIALGVVVTALVLATFAADAATSWGLATVESAPTNWPSLGDLAVGIAAGLLIAGTWTAVGVVLAVLLRGTALPIGLGLVWLLALENLIRGAAALLDVFDTVQKALPGVNAGSLVAELVSASGEGTPGVSAVVGGGQAAAVLAAYAVVGLGAAAITLQRRDVT
ncbi:MAG TPA: ABC transporter permease [Actinomycetes bacterium]|nr:ABC transporter permease [Actinomycetes bacterium]